MKTLNLLFLATLLFSFTGCEEKKVPQTPKSETNITVQEPVESNLTERDQEEELSLQKKHTFQLSGLNDSNHTVTIENKYIEISNVGQKIILINFFATWCPPCKGEIPYLADLKKKYKDSLFIAGILVNDNPTKDVLKKFITQYGINYFVSNAEENTILATLAAKRLKLGENFPIPLTILFKNGYYYSHYVGAVPVEMLEHDIKNAMNKE